MQLILMWSRRKNTEKPQKNKFHSKTSSTRDTNDYVMELRFQLRSGGCNDTAKYFHMTLTFRPDKVLNGSVYCLLGIGCVLGLIL